MNKALEALGVFALVIGCIFLNLFMLTKIWIYTIHPLGAPTLTMFQMWGVYLFVSCLSYKKPEKKETVEQVRDALSYSLTIAIGWLLSYLFFG